MRVGLRSAFYEFNRHAAGRPIAVEPCDAADMGNCTALQTVLICWCIIRAKVSGCQHAFSRRSDDVGIAMCGGAPVRRTSRTDGITGPIQRTAAFCSQFPGVGRFDVRRARFSNGHVLGPRFIGILSNPVQGGQSPASPWADNRQLVDPILRTADSRNPGPLWKRRCTAN